MSRALTAPAALFALLLPALVAAADRPDLSGIWLLNEADSDDPVEVMRERLDDRNRPRPRVLPGDTARGGGSWGSDPLRLPGADRPRAQGLRRPGEGTERLEITHADPSISIRFADGLVRSFHTDGRDPSDDFEAGLLNLSGKWKKKQLVFSAESAYGGKIREVYELAQDSKRLMVTIKQEGDGRTPGIVFTRVYDRVEAWETLSTDDEAAEPSPPESR